MTIIFEEGGPDHVVAPEAMRQALRSVIEFVGDTGSTLVLPPDGTRLHSGAGRLTQMLWEETRNGARFDVMPALGTHAPMTREELQRNFGTDLPLSAFLEHRWREDLVRLGQVPSEYVHEVSDGALTDLMPDYSIPVEINRRIVEGGYSAIVSIGQVVPHEVAGMANGFKNVLVGTGGQQTINRSHFLGAVYGMERMMGGADNPVRKVLTFAHEHYLKPLSIVYVMTVMEPDGAGGVVMRGLFAGDDDEAFQAAAGLSRQVNVTIVDEPQDRVAAFLDPLEFKTTWLGNKAVYRTRMAMADGGELTVLAPGLRGFGEDPEIDRLVRRYGYRGTPATLAAVRENPELQRNLSAAAHLIHGSSEGRFRIVYATDPSLLSRREVESVGFEWRNLADALAEFPPDRLREGPNRRVYYVGSPALGLWAARERIRI
jgi:nickel-dependent lactate racemase